VERGGLHQSLAYQPDSKQGDLYLGDKETPEEPFTCYDITPTFLEGVKIAGNEEGLTMKTVQTQNLCS